MRLQVNIEPYRSILKMLECYPNGLELKHFCYELSQDMIDRKRKPRKTKKGNRPMILKEHKIEEYLIY